MRKSLQAVKWLLIKTKEKKDLEIGMSISCVLHYQALNT